LGLTPSPAEDRRGGPPRYRDTLLDWQQRRQIIRTLVSRVEIGEEGATVVYRVPASTNPESGDPGPDRELDQHLDGQIIPLFRPTVIKVS